MRSIQLRGIEYTAFETGDDFEKIERNHQCEKCTRVLSRGSIGFQKESQMLRAKINLFDLIKIASHIFSREDKIIELGLHTLPGWTGHSMWYAFECEFCGEVSVDYVHGERAYLICQNQDCKEHSDYLNNKRFYFNDDRTSSELGFFQELIEIFRVHRELHRLSAGE